MLGRGSRGKLKVLFVGSELAPFVKVGGLGEVLRVLPGALRDLGHDARALIPKFGVIDEEKFPMRTELDQLHVPDPGKDDLICNVKSHVDEDGAVSYFLENEEYYEKRGSVYGYDDDAARWALLCRGALEFIRSGSGWVPDVIVANDWQGGLIPNLIKREYRDDPVLGALPVVFVIHNIHYQGMFDHRHVNELDYDDGQSEVPSIADPRISKLNFMRRGIRYADVISTVSPSYAREITTPAYGEGLDTLLQERRSCLFGIINGISYEQYDPESNPHVEHHYSRRSIAERARNKRVLQQKFNLPEDDSAFLVAIVSRLSEQKGLDLVAEAIEPLLANFNTQLVVLGSGEPRYMTLFEDLDKRHERVATHLIFDEILPHVIYAGADAVLIPSRFEPSGLTQMEAMRYGAIPIVRRIGGLADTVEDVDPQEGTGTGFSFDAYDSYALFGAVVRAIEAHKYPKVWRDIQQRAMAADFSWEKSAKEYVRLFERALDQLKQQ